MKLQIIRFFLSLFIVHALLLNDGLSAQNIYNRLTALKCDSLVKANEKNPNFVILDVRTHGEWVGDHLEDAINRSTGDADFKQQLEALSKHKIYLLHCKSGGRSAGAFAKMKELQFAEVYEMIGGINSWKANGLPTTPTLAPKLMLVSYANNHGEIEDTLSITVTNRANDKLKFISSDFADEHAITHNFEQSTQLSGAQDYSFHIIHTPGFLENESTSIKLESNGGTLDFQVEFKDGVIQSILNKKTPEEEFLVYPNPVKNRLYFKGLAAADVGGVTIYNVNGQMVLQKKDYSPTDELNISALNNGIYFVQFKSKNHIFNKKIVVKNF